MKELKYPIAHDKQGQIIKAADAVKGDSYACIYCHQQMILRRSEKQLVRTHFAHKALSPNCTPESALHLAFKTLLYEKIKACIENNRPLPFRWQCSYCLDEHEGNLLKKVARAEMEFDAGVCIPDIALFDSDNRLFAAIEVVVSHAPDEQALKFYDENNIIIIEFHLKDENDLDMPREDILNPNKVSICLNDKCLKCDKHLSKMYLNIIQVKCWECLASIKVALFTGGDDSFIAGPEKFTLDNWGMAKSQGVTLAFQQDKIINKQYLSNVCPECQWVITQYFLAAEYLPRALKGEYSREKIESGYFCHHCGF
jgi:hypothetical protein